MDGTHSKQPVSPAPYALRTSISRLSPLAIYEKEITSGIYGQAWKQQYCAPIKRTVRVSPPLTNSPHVKRSRGSPPNRRVTKPPTNGFKILSTGGGELIRKRRRVLEETASSSSSSSPPPPYNKAVEDTSSLMALMSDLEKSCDVQSAIDDASSSSSASLTDSSTSTLPFTSAICPKGECGAERGDFVDSLQSLTYPPVFYTNPEWPPVSKQIAWKKRKGASKISRRRARSYPNSSQTSKCLPAPLIQDSPLDTHTVHYRFPSSVELPLNATLRVPPVIMANGSLDNDQKTLTATATTTLSPAPPSPTRPISQTPPIPPASAATLPSRDGAKLLQNLAHLQDGLSTRRSTLGRGAGLGLFAERTFKRNEVITEYAGIIIDREMALELRNLGASSHVIRVGMQHAYLNGFSSPFPYIGGGSFANDGRRMADGITKGPGNNAQHFVWHDYKLGRDRVFLKALKDIQVDEEILIGYDNTYWKYHKWQTDAG